MPEEIDLLPELVLRTDDSAYRRATMALAVCLAARPEDLRDLVTQLWPDDEASVAAAVDRVLAAPFVEETAAGWRINGDFVASFVDRFMDEDRNAFQRAHEILASREREATRGLSNIDPNLLEMESWFVQARLAFYLAGVHADESAEQFGLAFQSAPQRELTPARLWLSTLVFRQKPLLGEHARVIAFFEGFRAYVVGRRSEALSYLNEVIAGDSTDLYQAIGLHLYAICHDRPSARIRDLTKSVELSEQLGLSDNAIMARNSLIVAHLAMARELKRSGQSSLSERHLRLAERFSILNLDQARETEVKGYQAYAINEHAIVQWALVAGLDGRGGRSPEAQNALSSVLDELSEGVVIADSAALSDTALFSINQRASVLRDAGHVAAAVSELELSLDRISPFTDAGVIVRLAKTAGSLQRRINADLVDRLRKVRETLDEWSSSTNPS